jgi:Laminin G domain
MRKRSLVVAVAAASLLLGAVSPAHAASSRVVAVWEMNESAGSRSMADDSGHGLRGSIGREVGTGVRVDGARGYRFGRLDPDTPPTHPQHLVTVHDYDELDPGNRDYSVTVRLRTTYQFGNIVQKGQATVAGGNWKLQIPNGIVQCLFRGSSSQIIVSAPRRINDGRWHTVRCDRTGSGVTLRVDGSEVAHRSGWTGRIANSWPLSIGGKTDCDQIDVGCDYYAGDIDYVEVDAN